MDAQERKAARERLVRWAKWGVAHEPQIHYTMSGKRSDWMYAAKPHTVPNLPLSTDCSGFVTMCYLLAGLDDPNGLGYKRLGYTGTLLDHCRLVTRKSAMAGDLVVYGPETGHHVTIIIGKQKGNRIVVSHGQEAGPIIIGEQLEERYQPSPTRFLRAPQLRTLPAAKT